MKIEKEEIAMLMDLKGDVATLAAGVKEQVKTLFENHERQQKLIEDFSKVALACELQGKELERQRNDINGLVKDVKEIKDKPSKKMDQIWGYVVGTLVTGVVAFLLLRLGLK